MKILSDLEIKKSDFTLKDFENRFRIVSNPLQQNFFYFWDEIIGEMTYAGRTGNARVNQNSFNSLKNLIKAPDLTLKK